MKIKTLAITFAVVAFTTLVGGTIYALSEIDFSASANDWAKKTCTEQLSKQPSSGASGEKATICYNHQETAKNRHELTTQGDRLEELTTQQAQDSSELSLQKSQIQMLSTQLANYQKAPPTDFAFFTNYPIRYGGYKTSAVYDANLYTKFSMTFTCSSSTNDKIKYWIETSADKINWSPQGYYEVHCNGIYGGASTNVGSTAARYYQIAVQPITANNNTNTINSFARFSN